MSLLQKLLIVQFITKLSMWKFSRAVCMVESNPLATVIVSTLSPGISYVELSVSSIVSSSSSPSPSLSVLDFFSSVGFIISVFSSTCWCKKIIIIQQEKDNCCNRWSDLTITRWQILDSSKLKESADDNFKFDENGRKLCKQVEKHFSTVFSKGLSPKGVKRCYCVGMG